MGSVKSNSHASRAALDTVDPQTAANRFAVVVVGILIIIALGVAAIVLPFILDSYCNCPSVPNISGSSPPATSPTVSPGTPTINPDVSDQFLQLVNNYARAISGDEPFEDPQSPQYRAAQFIADNANFVNQLSKESELDDLYALTVFYYSTNGDDWTECSQDGTVCDGTSWLDPDAVQCQWNWIECNQDGRVVNVIFGTCCVKEMIQ